jgi:hypothetical protein
MSKRTLKNPDLGAPIPKRTCIPRLPQQVRDEAARENARKYFERMTPIKRGNPWAELTMKTKPSPETVTVVPFVKLATDAIEANEKVTNGRSVPSAVPKVRVPNAGKSDNYRKLTCACALCGYTFEDDRCGPTGDLGRHAFCEDCWEFVSAEDVATFIEGDETIRCLVLRAMKLEHRLEKLVAFCFKGYGDEICRKNDFDPRTILNHQ